MNRWFCAVRAFGTHRRDYRFNAAPLGGRLSALHPIFRQIFPHFRKNLTKNYAGNLTRDLCAVLPLHKPQRCVLALSNSRSRSPQLARSCVHILSWRGIRRALSRLLHRPPPPQPLQAASCGWLILTYGVSLPWKLAPALCRQDLLLQNDSINV